MSSDLNYPCFQYHQHSNGRDIRHHPENAIARPAQQMLKRPLNESSKQRVTYLPARLQVQLKRIGSVAAHHSEI
jgi:hypothetical protein